MLTESDLNAVKNLLDERLEVKLDKKLGPIKRDLKKIRKDLDVAITLFDRDIVDYRKRIETLENNPNLKLKQF